MEIKNKMEKVWMGLAGIFLTIIIVLSFKLSDDNRKLMQVMESLKTVPANNEKDAVQAMISQTREDILTEAAKSPVQNITQSIVTKTVVPGKIIKQEVPATSTSPAKKASKTTKTS